MVFSTLDDSPSLLHYYDVWMNCLGLFTLLYSRVVLVLLCFPLVLLFLAWVGFV